jgi:class 3 adenylate cyclase
LSHEAHLAILFADVSSSTALYNTLGDDAARGVIARCLSIMTAATRHFGGRLIKTIGDEAMSTFATADAAAEAAIEMHETIAGSRSLAARRLAIHAGFHFGPVVLDNGDVFGDAVNIAARMVDYAKADQIVTTGETVTRLAGSLGARCRQIDGTRLKGWAGERAIHELVWREEDATIRGSWSPEEPGNARMVLTHGPTRLELHADCPSVTLGRGEQNDLVIRHACVSRQHARIEYRNGRFVLTDVSANGTYVLAPGADCRLVRRDSLELSGAGMLGLGEAIARESPTSVTYLAG